MAAAPAAEASAADYDHDEESVLLLKPANQNIELAKPSKAVRAFEVAGVLATVAWIVFCITYAVITPEFS